MVRLVPSPGATTYKYLIWNLDTVLTDDTAGTDVAKQSADYNIIWVKILRNDASHDNVKIRIGSATAHEIELSQLVRPDTDVMWEGTVSGKIYVSNAAALANGRLKILVGVRA